MKIKPMDKILYSTSEMVQLGYSRHTLYTAARSEVAKEFLYKTPGGGKFMFHLKNFQRYWKV